jgi:hypothetical protein
MKPFLIFFLVLLAACTPPTEMASAAQIAEQFLMASDFSENIQLLESNTLRCDDCFVFIFRVAEANEAAIVVEKGEVVQAIIDNSWDELHKRPIESFSFETTGISVYYCARPRPVQCGTEGEKVCSSQSKDFQNPCLACRDAATKWYTQGACELGYSKRVIDDLSRGRITKDSGPALILLVWHLNE